MKTSEVIEAFGSQTAVARALGIKPPAISQWGDEPPPLRQLQLQQITAGRLRASESITPNNTNG